MPGSWSARAIRSWNKNGRPSSAALPGLFSAEKLAAFHASIGKDILERIDDDSVTAMKQQARSELQRVASQTSGGIPPLSRVVVDGRRDDRLSTVQADSRIVINWSYLPEAAFKTYEALVERSPRTSGDYIRGILVFVDGAGGTFNSITYDTQEVRIVASVDYARRLEVGKDAHGQPWVKQVAPHIVEETALVARRVLGNFANFQYTYVELAGAWQLSHGGTIPRHFENGVWRHGRSPRTRNGQVEGNVLYPAIVITPVV